MTNLALRARAGKLDVPFARAAVGDRYVVEMLHEKGWLFGGENSGTSCVSTGTRPAMASSPRCRC
jgi:phosphomannomutase